MHGVWLSVKNKDGEFLSSFQEGITMVVKIRYKNNRYDLVKDEMFDQFLGQGKIKEFYRYSENRWVIVGRDPMRRETSTFTGTERRSPELRRILQNSPNV